MPNREESSFTLTGPGLDPETGLPGPLDELVRNLHALWCDVDDPEPPPGWHWEDADPYGAALELDTVLSQMATDQTEESAFALRRLNAVFEALRKANLTSPPGRSHDQA